MKSALRRKIKAGVNYCIPIHMCSANLLPHSLNAVAHNSICLFWAVRRFHWPITQKLRPWSLAEVNGFIMQYAAVAV
jgi:hypothetical protein